jgi:transcriptional regulator with XRE-family HTH domain
MSEREIKKIRLRLGLTQKELGAHTGVSDVMISKLERGVCYPSLDLAVKLSHYFQFRGINIGAESFSKYHESEEK